MAVGVVDLAVAVSPERVDWRDVTAVARAGECRDMSSTVAREESRNWSTVAVEGLGPRHAGSYIAITIGVLNATWAPPSNSIST